MLGRSKWSERLLLFGSVASGASVPLSFLVIGDDNWHFNEFNAETG